MTDDEVIYLRAENQRLLGIIEELTKPKPRTAHAEAQARFAAKRPRMYQPDVSLINQPDVSPDSPHRSSENVLPVSSVPSEESTPPKSPPTGDQKGSTDTAWLPVFEEYKRVIQPAARPIDAAKVKIQARLKTYSQADLFEAIRRFKTDQWRMENNANQGAAWFFDSDKRIETFINLTPRRLEKPAVSVLRRYTHDPAIGKNALGPHLGPPPPPRKEAQA